MTTLHANPNAFYAGMISRETAESKSMYNRLGFYAQNPAAVIMETVESLQTFNGIWQNPTVLDFMLKKDKDPFSRCKHINWAYLACNPHPEAVRLSIARLHKNPWIYSNPKAIEWIREQPREIIGSTVFANPAAIDIIKEFWDDPRFNKYHHLSLNPHPWAIEHLREHQDRINWDNFSTNPGIFECRAPAGLVALLYGENA